MVQNVVNKPNSVFQQKPIDDNTITLLNTWLSVYFCLFYAQHIKLNVYIIHKSCEKLKHTTQ